MELLFGQENLKEFINCNYNNIDNNYVGLYFWIRESLLSDNKKLYDEFINMGITDVCIMCQFIINLFHMYVKLKNKKVD